MYIKHFIVLCIFIVPVLMNDFINPEDYHKMMEKRRNKNMIINSTKYDMFKHHTYVKKPMNEDSYDHALEAIFAIGVRLQILLEQSKASTTNFLVSPVSIAITVGQLMLGATGSLRRHLADILLTDGGERVRQFEYDVEKNKTKEEIPLLNIHKEIGHLTRILQHKDDAFVLKSASALFLQPGIGLTQLFEQSIRDIYETSLVPANFSSDPTGSQRLVNKWATENTGGRINSIFPEPLPPSTAAILTNAVYFKAEWETPFSDELTTQAPFNVGMNKTVIATYLRGQIDTKFVRSKQLNCSMVVLPYKDEKTAMYVVLPNLDDGNEFSIATFTKNLKSKDVLDLINAATPHTVLVMLPKMSLSTTFSLLDPVKRYQFYKDAQQPLLNRRFVFIDSEEDRLDDLDKRIEQYKNFTKVENKNETINLEIGKEKDPLHLDGASKDPNFRLSDIVQQISLAVNEKGTEAAAVSASIIDYSGGVVLFKAIRPFLFFIRHEETGAILFWGTIVDPTQT